MPTQDTQSYWLTQKYGCQYRWILALMVLGFGWQLTPCLAENWPQWRGPTSQRHLLWNETCPSNGRPLLGAEWKNVAWKLPLPGPAGSTPVIWEDQIYLTSATEDDQLILLCMTTSGKELWRRVLDRGNRAVRGDEGNLASPSPSTDGEAVWALVGTGKLACFDASGNEQWRVDLGRAIWEDRYRVRSGFDAHLVSRDDSICN